MAKSRRRARKKRIAKVLKVVGSVGAVAGALGAIYGLHTPRHRRPYRGAGFTFESEMGNTPGSFDFDNQIRD